MTMMPQHARHWWRAAALAGATLLLAAVALGVLDDDTAGGVALPTTTTAGPSPDGLDGAQPWVTTTTEPPPTTTTSPPPPPTTATPAPPPTAAPPSPPPPSPPPPPAPDAVHDTATEARLRTLLSGHRRSIGQPDFASSGSLNAYAADWSRQMAEGPGLAHSPGSHGAVQGACGGCGSGENVGYGQSADQVWNLFLQSSGHRANIEKPGSGIVGVGAYRKGTTVWITLVFGYS